MIVLATGMEESSLHNYSNPKVPASLSYPSDGVPASGGDHLSVGPLQQQAGMSWGTVDQLMHPDWQAKQFLTRLLQIPNWQAIAPTQAAQAVQVSAFGSAYAKWMDPASQILGEISGVVCNNGDDAGTGGRQAVVQAAMRWVGTPYSVDAGSMAGPTLGDCQPGPAANDCHIVGFDCSGLTMFAYGKVGLSLAHFAETQYYSGPHIDRSQLEPGDLLFLGSNTADPSSIHHVVMWIGNDSIVQAPESGELVDVVAHPFSQKWFSSEYYGATRPSIPGGIK